MAKILPGTRSLIKNNIAPKIVSKLRSILPERNGKEVQKVMNPGDIEKLVRETIEKYKQISGAFDYYHQSNAYSLTPNVLERLYGRDMYFLRQYYQMCSPIDQLIFGKRYEQLRAISDCVEDDPTKIGWRVVHKKKGSPKFKATKEIDEACRWLEKLIKKPNKMRHPGGFPEVLNSIAESKMLFDRIPIEILEHVDYKKAGMDGMPSSYVIPDAATIKPTAWVLYAMAGAPGYSGKTDYQQTKSIVQGSAQTANSLYPANMDMQEAMNRVSKQLAEKNIYGELGVYGDSRPGIISWVQQMPDRLISAGYTDKTINVFIANASPQINAWGWSSGSAFERSFEFGEVICKMTGYNHEIFDSRMPEGVLLLDNAGADKKKKQQMHERMIAEGSDRYSNLMVEFVNDPDKSAKYLKIKDKPSDMQFKEMFILYVKLKCASYGMDYTELNIEDGKSAGLGGSGAHEKRMDQHAASGIVSDARYYAHCITRALIEPWSQDYMMEFVHDTDDSEGEVKLRTDKMAYKSLDETRTEDNLEDEWWKNAPKEIQEELKAIWKYDFVPGLDKSTRTQLILKDKEIAANKEMQEQAAEEEGEQTGQEGEEQPGEPKEDEEITNLKSAIGQQEKENKELEAGMEKSIPLVVEHHYLS